MGLDGLEGSPPGGQNPKIPVRQGLGFREMLEGHKIVFPGQVALVRILRPFGKPRQEVLVQGQVPGVRIEGETLPHDIGNRPFDGLAHDGVITLHIPGQLDHVEEPVIRPAVVIGGGPHGGQA